MVTVPTAEPPYYRFQIGMLAGGRRLLSDDIAMLEAVAVMAARRIDALRVTHERCEQSLREQEINKLATEAQLRALRAQINPHFLFNALTTIGYLVQTAPDRALETLMKLTSLLRSVLRTDGEFVTLEQEVQLIVSYLDIERARFEERLRVSIDIPKELLSVRIPSLLVQPLVENAIKHGITPSRFGGEVRIRARLERALDDASRNSDVLEITVSDSGIGASEIELARGRRRGVGLSNLEERLRSYGGASASLQIDSVRGEGTIVELRLPLLPGVPDRSSGSVLSIGEKRGA
jgi:two-component system LytT family sensor kinase